MSVLLPPGALGLNAFNHPWKLHVSYLFPPLALIPLVLSTFLLEQVTSQFRLILEVPCWIEAPWLPTVLNMLIDVPLWCPVVKDLNTDVSVDQVLKGLPLLHLNFWLLRDVSCVDKGSLPLSASGLGDLSVYSKSLPAVLETMSILVCLRGFTKQWLFLSSFLASSV